MRFENRCLRCAEEGCNAQVPYMSSVQACRAAGRDLNTVLQATGELRAEDREQHVAQTFSMKATGWQSVHSVTDL